MQHFTQPFHKALAGMHSIHFAARGWGAGAHKTKASLQAPFQRGIHWREAGLRTEWE